MENTENQQTKTKRDLTRDRMVGKYPDRSFDDDEALFGQINDDYDAYDKEIAGYKEREGKFAKLMSDDPRSAKFLNDWQEGGDPAISLVRMFGQDIKDAIDDPDKLDQIAAANKEFVDRVAKEKELEDEYEKNLASSLELVDQYQQKNGLSDDQVDQAMTLILSVIKDGVMGKFSGETIDMAMKAINHDSDVDAAAEEAEVRGKNARIEEKLRKPSQGDGVAMLNGRSNTTNHQGKNRGIFGLAAQAR